MQPIRWCHRRTVVLAVCALSFSVFLWLKNELGGGVAVQNVRLRNGPFQKIYVHLDLKGAPPKPAYIVQFFTLLRALGVDGVVVEYEDMFPFTGTLSKISRPIHYTADNIKFFVTEAQRLNIEIIPLVQTFGHLEFVLKHSEFRNLSESVETVETKHSDICPSEPKSYTFINNLLQQIRDAHPFSHTIHIGSDEVHHLLEDQRCKDVVRKMSSPANASEIIKLNHISRVSDRAKALGFETVLAWNDMFQHTSVDFMRRFNLGAKITPVIWGYAQDVTKVGYFPDKMFARYSKVFDRLWFGSAFKGATGIKQIYNHILPYFANHRSYINLLNIFSEELDGKVEAIIITGWQRYFHFGPLCELLPASIPSLVFNYFYLNDIRASKVSLLEKSMKFLNCSASDLPVRFSDDVDSVFGACSFPGHEVYEIIMSELHSYTTGERNLTHIELQQLKYRMADQLKPIYYDVDVNEFLVQNLNVTLL